MAGAAVEPTTLLFACDWDGTLVEEHTSGSEGRPLREEGHIPKLVCSEALQFIRLALKNGHDVAIVSFADNKDADPEEGILGGEAYIRAVLSTSGLEKEYLDSITIEAYRAHKVSNKNGHLAKILARNTKPYKEKFLIDDEEKNRRALPEDFIGIDAVPYRESPSPAASISNIMTRAEFWSKMLKDFFKVPCFFKGAFETFSTASPKSYSSISTAANTDPLVLLQDDSAFETCAPFSLTLPSFSRE